MAVLPSGGERDGDALVSVNRSCADQLAALLGPDTAAANIDPSRASLGGVVVRPAHDNGVTVGGQQRTAMRADLLEVRLRAIDDNSERCLGAFWDRSPGEFPEDRGGAAAEALTQKQLAKPLRKPELFVSNYERGNRRIDVLELLPDR
jgi:hypothetical protein